MVNTDELLGLGLPTLLAAFFNCRERDPRYFEVVSAYKRSIKSDEPLDLHGTARKLTQKYGLPFVVISDTVITAEIRKSRPTSLTAFRKELLSKILELLASEPKGNAMNREIALALIGLRGSSDHAGYYAVDAQSGNSDHIRDVLDLLIKHGTLGNQVNFNPRANQPGFVAGTKKDDQVRLRLDWVRGNLREGLGSINSYKLAVLDASMR
ncbi:MAG: hypothetical protein RLZZ56_1231 [Actinomycetota bacterium]